MGTLLSLALAGIFLAQPVPAPASRSPAVPGPMADEGSADITGWVRHLAREIGASEEQVRQLEAIAREHAEQAQAMRSRHRDEWRDRARERATPRDELREADKAGDRERARELRGQLRGRRDDAPRELLRRTRDKIEAILTDEQRPIFERMMERLRDRVGPRIARPVDDFQAPEGGEVFRLTERLIDAVHATEEQKTLLMAIARDHVRAIKNAEAQRIIGLAERREEIRELHRQQRETEDPQKRAEIGRRLREILGPPAHEIMRQTHDRMSGVLTNEQKAEFSRLLDRTRPGAEPPGRGRRGGPEDRPRPRPPRGPAAFDDLQEPLPRDARQAI